MVCGIGFQDGKGGKSAIDFIIEDEGCSFIEAVEKLMQRMGSDNTNYKQNSNFKLEKSEMKKSIEKQIVLPPKCENNKRVFAYLNSRGIDKEIINYCIDNNLMYEEALHHNVVFLGYDENGKVKFGCARATNQSRIMHDLKDSSKEYSFGILSKENLSTLHIFESAIDLLSYATLIKNMGMNFRNYNFISLSGVYQTANKIEESKVPVVLKSI